MARENPAGPEQSGGERAGRAGAAGSAEAGGQGSAHDRGSDGGLAFAARSTCDPVLPALAATTGSPVLSGNRVELLRNGERYFPRMLEAIASAQESVDLLTYVWWTGAITDRFTEALVDAAGRGVRVRVLVDGYGGLEMDAEQSRALLGGGCDVAIFRPPSLLQPQRSNHRTHRKVMVVDGELAFTGGAGIAAEWDGDGDSPGSWRDDQFEVHGPLVAWLEGAFLDNWVTATGRPLTDRHPVPRQLEAEGDTVVVPLFSSAGARPTVVERAFVTLFSRAEERIDVVTPYFGPSPETLEALCRASEEGVRVRLLVPGEHTDSKMASWLCEALQPRLLGAGIEVWEFQPTLNHCKTLLVDDQVAMIGSANLDCRSLHLNDELNLVVCGQELLAALRDSVEQDFARSRRIERSEVEGRSLLRDLRNRALLLLRSQL
ncbi:MAG: hypothetical protein DWQ30_11685 [Acidobacteria bacterium]|nr:MAG: hypothetical protein DWQ30_11685 [Acidobacteriota bacterium]